MSLKSLLKLLFFAAIILIFNCKKEPQIPEKPGSLSSTAVSQTEIDLSWRDNSTNESGFIIERSLSESSGWSKVTSLATNTGSYRNSGLTASTTYYFRVYAYNAEGNSEFSNTANATTLDIVPTPPELTTSSVSSITHNSAASGGNITSDGNEAVTARGVCWSTSENPTTANDTTLNGSGTGSFVANLTGLTPSTLYYVRAYAINSVDTSYGQQLSFTTEAPPVTVATVTTTAVTSITTTAASSGGNVTDDGSAAVTSRGVCWSTTENPTTANDTTKNGSGKGSFTASLTGLTPATIYYVRAYAINTEGTAYGAQVQFTTSSVVAPTLTTTAVSSITSSSAVSGGNVTSDGGSSVTMRGICYSITENPTVESDTTVNGSGTGSFTSNLTDLYPNTQYYVRAYAINSHGTAYGNEITFTTSIMAPTATTLAATSVKANSVTLNGTVNANGSSTSVSFEYGNTDSYGSDITASPDATGGINATAVVANVTGLTPDTEYHFRVKAESEADTVYGDDITFTTLEGPIAVTLDADTIFPTTAWLHGYVNANGIETTIKFEYGPTDSYGTIMFGNPNIATGDAGEGNLPSDLKITGLSKSTLYHFRIVAENAQGKAYGNDKTFTTLENDPVVPTVSTKTVSSITSTSATGGGTVTDDGGAPVTVRGICYSTVSGPTTDDQITVSGSGTGDFISPFTGLTPGTLYYVRAYATNMMGTAYGDEVTFTTAAPPAGLPTVETTAISDITAYTASGGGNITDDGGGTITARGICWNTSENPTTADSKTEDGTGSGTYTSSLTGLGASTIYYVRAYATNSAGTAYGNQVNFTTSDPPAGMATLTTTSISDITSSTASGGGNITDDGGGAITARGICYSVSEDPTIADSHTTDGTGTGTFISAMTELSASTLYYVRAYATNSAGTAYGNQVSFTTFAEPGYPVLTTTSVTGIGTNEATSGGDITDDGDGAGPVTVTARGVCWSTASNPTTSDNTTSDGSGTGAYSSSISGLYPCTTYHVRAYATNSEGYTAYGADRSFTTSAVSPSITTTSISSLTTTSASSGGTISGDCSDDVTERGVCWSTSSGPTTSGSHSSDGTGGGSYTSSITGLDPCTTYYVRAYAINGAGTVYGNEVSFTTNTAVAVVGTTEVTSIASYSAFSGGTVSGSCADGVTERGICWNTTGSPVTSDSKDTDTESGGGSYSGDLTGLTPDTKYYVRAYAINQAGTAYGNELTFTTSPPPYTLATLTTTVASSVTSSTATSGGNISDDGGATVTARGVCYSINENPTIVDNYTTDGTGTGSFTSSLTDLSASTLYYVRAYVTNAAGTAYGNQVSFTTFAEPGYPALTTNTVTGISTNSASCGGNITDDGDGAGPVTVTARGVCWSTASNPTTSDNTTSDGSGTGAYSSSISGLYPCTTYHVRAYATNSEGYTAYGADRSFTTGAVLPSITTTSVSSITTISASSGGTISGDCSADVTARGVCWSTSSGPTTSGSHTTDGTGGGSYSSSITGLDPCTTYYVRAYATNAAGTIYGNELSFNTGSAPASVSTASISSVTSTSAASGGTVSGDCTEGVTARGVCWNTTGSPVTSDSKTINGTGGGSFTSSITGLYSCTTYYVRAYATNSSGTSYGNQLSFTTGTVMATVSTANASSITTTTATSGGTVSGDCGGTVTARGVCWSTSQNPTTANSKTTDGSGGGSYSSSITDLMPCTTYYVRSYATNPAGTVYGNQVPFTTSAVLVTLSTTVVSSVTSTTASSGGTISGYCTSGVTDRGVCWSSTGTPTTSNSHTSDGTGTGTFTSSITDLNPCTFYYYRAYAINAAGTKYGTLRSFTTGYSNPSVSTTSASSITSSSAVSGGTISGDCASTVTARGVCWNTSQNPTTANSKTINGSGSGSFTSNITNLQRTTTYYVRAYATYPGGTVYGNQISFTTLAVLPSVTTSSISIVSNTNAAAGGNVTSDGGASVTARGVCWSTSLNPTISNSKTTNGSGTGSFTSSISGLNAGTTYRVRAYATNSVGTAYGANVTIITPSTVTDLDGNSYNTVKIGSQTWMQKNLKVTQYNNGDAINAFSDTSLYANNYHAYNNVTDYKNRYGLMYSGSVVTDSRNVCPAGWHIPTITEWSNLATTLGGSSVAGAKMTQISAIEYVGGYYMILYFWNMNITGHNNSSMFYARGGGYNLSGSDTGLGDYVLWWSSSSKSYVYLYYNNNALNGLSSGYGTNESSLYIRCIHD